MAGEIRTDNTKTLVNALERIAELEKENAELKEQLAKAKVNTTDISGCSVWPVWHNLQKNPDDIPHDREGRLFIVHWRLGSIDGYRIAEKFVNPLKDAVAWCEIPEHTEE